MKRTAAKVIPGAPHDVLLVLDAHHRQNGLAQAREFTSAVAVTGIILTKLDGTAKGGIVVAISRELGLPIRFVGTGEQINDMVPFDAEPTPFPLSTEPWTHTPFASCNTRWPWPAKAPARQPQSHGGVA